MAKYKDLNNKVHEIEPAFFHLLPAGCVEITDAEADELLAPTLDQLKTKRKAEIAAEANGLIDAQTGGDARKQMMMIASGLAMLDKQVGRGGAPARDPKMDALAAIFEYVEAVNANEQEAFDTIDVAADPSTVVLVHPPLPA